MARLKCFVKLIKICMFYADVVLILCSSVGYTTRCFMFGLVLLFVYVFFCPFNILITLLGEEGVGICAYRACVC